MIKCYYIFKDNTCFFSQKQCDINQAPKVFKITFFVPKLMLKARESKNSLVVRKWA